MVYTATVEFDPETKLFVGIVPSVPGAHTCGETLEELRANLVEVLQLCLAEQPELAVNSSCFVGLTTVEV